MNIFKSIQYLILVALIFTIPLGYRILLSMTNNRPIVWSNEMMMHWKEQLRNMEDAKQWDSAIDFMKEVIAKNPNDMDAYMAMNYLLMNLLVEEDYNRSKRDYYSNTLKEYFDKSYAKFSYNPEYLFYMGKIAYMSEWYFGIELEDAKKMLLEALRLDPNNILYQDTYYMYLDLSIPENKEKALERAEMILKQNSPIRKILQNKGSMGEYLWELMVNYSKRVVANINTCGSSIYN